MSSRVCREPERDYLGQDLKVGILPEDRRKRAIPITITIAITITSKASPANVTYEGRGGTSDKRRVSWGTLAKASSPDNEVISYKQSAGTISTAVVHGGFLVI